MHHMLAEFESATSVEELQRRFAAFLGVDGPVPLSVIRRAQEDQHFRHNLVLTRNYPAMLRMLFNDPRNSEYEGVPAPDPSLVDSTTPERADPRGNAELVGKLGKAMVQWGLSGFTQIDDETYERRWGTCQGCEHLKAPPDQAIYKLVAGRKTDQRVCNACGCVASRKARVPTERCPVADPQDPSVNRWGQPLPSKN